MLDRRLRPYAEVVLNPLACSSPRWLSPNTVTLIGLAAGLGAAYYASTGDWETALWLFAINRAADGVDGLLARTRERTSDTGANLDVLADTAAYCALAFGIAAELELWSAAATAALMLVIQMLVRLMTGAPKVETQPTWLIENGELMVLFVLAIVFPERAEVILWLTALLVAASATLGFARSRSRS